MNTVTQTPARGIMLDADYSGSRAYTIACACHDGDHAVNMWIELEGDTDDRSVTLTFFVNTTTPFWQQGFSRIRAAWAILVRGYREDHHMVILHRQAALNVANTITTVIAELEDFKKENK